MGAEKVEKQNIEYARRGHFGTATGRGFDSPRLHILYMTLFGVLYF